MSLPIFLPIPRYGQFSVKNAHFSYPPAFNPKFENVSLALHSPNAVRRQP